MNRMPWSADQLARLLDHFADPLQLYAAQWTDEAADVVQEAFVQLIGLRRPPDNLAAWLFGVVRNRARNRLRARERRRRHEQHAGAFRPCWFEPSPEAGLDAERVTVELAALPLEQREVIVARIWGQLTLAEIAQLVGASISTVHRRYEAGLDSLRQRFDVVCPQTTPPTGRTTR